MSTHRLAVVATVSPEGAPQAAVMGIAVTPELEIIFDTVKTSRKYRNLKANPNVAVVIGGEGEVTVQYEGTAEEPVEEDLERCREFYLSLWPECRSHLAWPDITHVRIRPKWARYSNFNEASWDIAEMEFPGAGAAASGASI